MTNSFQKDSFVRHSNRYFNQKLILILFLLLVLCFILFIILKRRKNYDNNLESNYSNKKLLNYKDHNLEPNSIPNKLEKFKNNTKNLVQQKDSDKIVKEISENLSFTGIAQGSNEKYIEYFLSDFSEDLLQNFKFAEQTLITNFFGGIRKIQNSKKSYKNLTQDSLKIGEYVEAFQTDFKKLLNGEINEILYNFLHSFHWTSGVIYKNELNKEIIFLNFNSGGDSITIKDQILPYIKDLKGDYKLKFINHKKNIRTQEDENFCGFCSVFNLGNYIPENNENKDNFFKDVGVELSSDYKIFKKQMYITSFFIENYFSNINSLNELLFFDDQKIEKIEFKSDFLEIKNNFEMRLNSVGSLKKENSENILKRKNNIINENIFLNPYSKFLGDFVQNTSKNERVISKIFSNLREILIFENLKDSSEKSSELEKEIYSEYLRRIENNDKIIKENQKIKDFIKKINLKISNGEEISKSDFDEYSSILKEYNFLYLNRQKDFLRESIEKIKEFVKKIHLGQKNIAMTFESLDKINDFNVPGLNFFSQDFDDNILKIEDFIKKNNLKEEDKNILQGFLSKLNEARNLNAPDLASDLNEILTKEINNFDLLIENFTPKEILSICNDILDGIVSQIELTEV